MEGTCGPKGTIPLGGVILCIGPPMFGCPANKIMQLKKLCNTQASSKTTLTNHSFLINKKLKKLQSALKHRKKDASLERKYLNGPNNYFIHLAAVLGPSH